MSDISVSQVLTMLRSLPAQERLKVIAQALPEIEQEMNQTLKPRKSYLGFCADLGTAPSASEIDQATNNIIAFWGMRINADDADRYP